jgi:myosin I
VSKPKPAAQALPGQNKPVSAAKYTPQSSAAATSTSAPAPPPPPRSGPVAPPAPQKPMYKAKFAFQGQEGELTLAKDDEVELIQKDDNGASIFISYPESF